MAEGNKSNNSKIPDWQAPLIFIVAGLYDAVQAFLDFILIGLLFNWAISIWAWLTFFVWFSILGVKFGNPKKSLSLVGSLLIKLIPLLDMLPAWSGMVALIIAQEKAEALLLKHAGAVVGVAKLADRAKAIKNYRERRRGQQPENEQSGSQEKKEEKGPSYASQTKNFVDTVQQQRNVRNGGSAEASKENPDSPKGNNPQTPAGKNWDYVKDPDKGGSKAYRDELKGPDKGDSNSNYLDLRNQRRHANEPAKPNHDSTMVINR